MWNRPKRGLIFVIAGTSGSGKTTLANRILKQPQLKNKVVKSISFTTRPKRPEERRERDYLFVSKGEFRRLRKTKKILEHTHYLGYDYGTSRQFIERAIAKGLNVILCLDIRGAKFLKKRYPRRTITIFIKPPSLDAVEQRILGRYANTSQGELNQRLQLASKELGYAKYCDYNLVNDDLRKATREVGQIIQWAISQ